MLFIVITVLCNIGQRDGHREVWQSVHSSLFCFYSLAVFGEILSKIGSRDLTLSAYLNIFKFPSTTWFKGSIFRPMYLLEDHSKLEYHNKSRLLVFEIMI